MSNYGSPPPPPPASPAFGGYQQPGFGAAPPAAPLASWIQRVLAMLIDNAVQMPFLFMMFAFLPKVVTTTTVDGEVNTTQVGGSLGLMMLMSLLSIVVSGYNRWYLGGQGQSLGKKALGLTLVDERTGQPIGTGKAFLRDLVHALDGMMCYVGYLFPLWDVKRQTFADKIMGTVVTTN
jgi:uncharacterized RDD family membrane protein YckC